jgi:hypothetical protein
VLAREIPESMEARLSVDETVDEALAPSIFIIGGAVNNITC